MRLSDFVRSDVSRKDSTNIQLSAKQSQIVSRQIKALTPGQTLQGEVVARNGSEVQLRLSEDVILNARLNQDIQLDMGKLLTFEVKNNGQALTLSPLFANMATDVNVLKALDMASLPVNHSTISMTSRMMEVGMAVDRNTLQQVFREMNAYAGGEAGNVISLHQLGLPVNEQNVQQMQAYQNLTHQLLGGIRELTDGLAQMIQENVQIGNEQGLHFFGQLLELASSIQESEGMSIPAIVNDQVGTEVVAGDNSEASLKELSGNLQGAVQEEAATKDLHEGMQGSTAQISGEESLPDKLSERLEQRLTDGLREILSTIPKEDASLPELTARLNALEQGQLSGTEQMKLLQDIWKLGQSQEGKQIWSRMLGEEHLAKAFTQNIKEFLTISPEELSQPGKLEDFYKRLNQQLKGMERILSESGQSNSAVGRTVANLNQNVDFLQQMNQMYTYVQLPLKLLQGDTHGDLYVYSNKKHLASADGQVSALLHLDMEHLGPVDVYVALNGQKVNTKFYLQEDSLLDFLAEHMDILTSRLEKRGYQMNFEMQVHSPEEAVHSGTEPLLPKGTGMRLAEYAFDVRA